MQFLIIPKNSPQFIRTSNDRNHEEAELTRHMLELCFPECQVKILQKGESK